MEEITKTEEFKLFRYNLAKFIIKNFTIDKEFLNKLKAINDDDSLVKLFIDNKDAIYTELGGDLEIIKSLRETISDLNDEVYDLKRGIDDLEEEISDLEGDIEDIQLEFGSSLDDEIKRDFIMEYCDNYTPWEIEILLKNGKDYLKH